MSSRSLGRALLVAALGLMSSACLLVVSTSGLAGDPLVDAADAADATADTNPVDAGADAHDAFAAPDGSTTFSGNGHAYQIVVESGGISWSSARDLAKSMGGHLATIGDAKEEMFVLHLLSKHPEAVNSVDVGPWLGGYQATTDDEPDGGWVWIDDTPWSYTDWQPGQPDNTNGTENYLDLYSEDGTNFGWNDETLGGTVAPVISLLVEFE